MVAALTKLHNVQPQECIMPVKIDKTSTKARRAVYDACGIAIWRCLRHVIRLVLLQYLSRVMEHI